MKTPPHPIDRPQGRPGRIGRIALVGGLLLLGLAVIIWLPGRSAGSDLGKQDPEPQATTASPALVQPTEPVTEPTQPVFEPTPTSVPEPAATEPPARVEFTLRTVFRDGKMLYEGVGGDIDGLVNPDLIVAPGTVVRAILVNGDGMTHDLFFPDFDAHTDKIGRKEQRTEVTFTVSDQAGTYVYYCTLPGHRRAGQEGRLIVDEPA